MAADYNDPNLTRLMIVDDDEIVLNSAKEQLTVLGYHVTAVNHPQLALQHLQTETYSLILADYEMPEMTGLQFFATVEESHPDTSRLIFSSGISMGELSEAIGTGRVYRHVSKPWLKEDLQATVGNAMERYRLLKENETLQARNITLSQKLATAGESAGGLATILHADRVRSWLPQPLVTKFVAVPFSGFFLVSVVCSLKWELDDLTRLPGPQNCRWCAKVW